MVGAMDDFDAGDIVSIVDYEGRFVIISVHHEVYYHNGVRSEDKYYKCQRLETGEIIEATHADLTMISPKKGREQRIKQKQQQKTFPPLEREELDDFLDEYITLMSIAELYDFLGLKEESLDYRNNAKEIILLLKNYYKKVKEENYESNIS